MRALLDINLLIALIDPDHIFHRRAHAWWIANRNHGWASCPLTENGVVRVMSNPAYSRRMQLNPAELIELLGDFARRTGHEFWPDELSLRDRQHFIAERIHGTQQLTDIYLLGLATSHEARLVTFDQTIPLSAVVKAAPNNLAVV